MEDMRNVCSHPYNRAVESGMRNDLLLQTHIITAISKIKIYDDFVEYFMTRNTQNPAQFARRVIKMRRETVTEET